MGAKLKKFYVYALMVGLAFACIFEARGDYVDCRGCHLDPVPLSGVPDFFDYFADPARQHPVGRDFPPPSSLEYNFPTAQSGSIAFFDTNGNGIPDFNEIQLFGTTRTLECSSCHREHGFEPPTSATNMYLRTANTMSSLCSTCHRI